MSKLYRLVYISNPETDLIKLRNTLLLSLSIIMASSILLIIIDNQLLNQQFISKDFSYHVNLSLMMLLIIGILIISQIISRILKDYYKFKGLVEEETPFLILLASASPYSGYEIEHLIKKISSERNNIVFRGYEKIAYKIVNLSQYTSIAEAMRMISALIPVKKFSKLIKDYLYNKVRGSQREYLSLLSEEMIRELNNSVKRESSLKTNIQAVSLVIMTLIPILVSSLSRLRGGYPPFETDLLIILASVFLLTIIPRNPLVLRVVSGEKISLIRDRAIEIIIGIMIFSLLLRHYMLLGFNSNTFVSMNLLNHWLGTNLSLFSEYLLNNMLFLTMTLGLLGIHQLYEYISSLNELSKAKEILIQSLSHLRIFKELSGFDISRYLDLNKKLKSWLLNYILFSINYMKEIGVVIEELYEKFVDRILEILSIYRNYLLQNILYVIILLLQPYIFIKTEYMLQSIPGVHELFLISTILSSTITSKIIFGYSYNGLIVSCALLLYNSLMR